MINTSINKLIKVPKLSKDDPNKCKKLKEIFEIEPEKNTSRNTHKIKINYNETLFFNPMIKKNDYHNEKHEDNSSYTKQEELTKIINNVINSTIITNKAEKNPSIKVNLNINNNYYNSNYNYVLPNDNNSGELNDSFLSKI
jgi:hypothetical protein